MCIYTDLYTYNTHLWEAEEHRIRERVARSAEELQRESLIAHSANTQLRTKLLWHIVFFF